MNQQVMTGEDARAIKAYESQLSSYLHTHRATRRGAFYLTLAALALWPISYLASSGQGPVNTTAWFTAFSFVSFAGALASTAGAIGLSLFNTMDVAPEAPSLEPRETIG